MKKIKFVTSTLAFFLMIVFVLNITYANFVNHVNLIFEPGSGTLPSGVTTLNVVPNQTIQSSTGYTSWEQFGLVPYRSGFNFLGWEQPNGSLLGISTTTISPVAFPHQITLTPRWSPIDIWQIIFVANGGTIVDGSSERNVARGHTVWSHYGLPIGNFAPTVVNEGYTFGGWFVFGGVQPFTAQTPITSHIRVYARWISEDGVPPLNESAPPYFNGQPSLPDIPSLQPAIPIPPLDLTPPHNSIDNIEIIHDVHESHWALEYISFVMNEGIFNSINPGQFGPDVNMTRYMFAQSIFNLEGAENVFQTPQFNDVTQNHASFNAIQWASVMGIVQGVGNNNFDPNGDITREQIAVLLHRYASIFGIPMQQGLPNFTDNEYISPWAISAVGSVQSMGLISGRPDGSFDPQATATRAEVAAIFSRFING